MKTYAILYYNELGDVSVITVAGLTAQDAKEYTLSHYSHIIEEHNIIKVVKV